MSQINHLIIMRLLKCEQLKYFHLSGHTANGLFEVFG